MVVVGGKRENVGRRIVGRRTDLRQHIGVCAPNAAAAGLGCAPISAPPPRPPRDRRPRRTVRGGPLRGVRARKYPNTRRRHPSPRLIGGGGDGRRWVHFRMRFGASGRGDASAHAVTAIHHCSGGGSLSLFCPAHRHRWLADGRASGRARARDKKKNSVNGQRADAFWRSNKTLVPLMNFHDSRHSWGLLFFARTKHNRLYVAHSRAPFARRNALFRCPSRVRQSWNCTIARHRDGRTVSVQNKKKKNSYGKIDEYSSGKKPYAYCIALHDWRSTNRAGFHPRVVIIIIRYRS